MRALARGILLLVIVATLTAWFTAGTLATTLLNRDNPKQWAAQSGVYDNIVTTLVRVEQTETENSNLIDIDTLRQAISRTFPPAYLQQQTETALNATYDWIEGKKQAISFSIPISQKRDDFTQQLAALLEPRIAQLPSCGATMALEYGSCLPPNYTARNFAQDVARQTAQNGSLFEQPITEKTFAQNQQSAPRTDWLPDAARLIPVAVITLPIVIVFAALGYVMLSGSRLKGMVVVGRRIFIHSLLFALLGGLAWYYGESLQLSGDAAAQNDTILRNIVEPLLHAALPAAGLWLMIFSGSAAVVSGGVWLVAFILRRKKENTIAKTPVFVAANQPAAVLPPTPSTQRMAPKGNDTRPKVQ